MTTPLVVIIVWYLNKTCYCFPRNNAYLLFTVYTSLDMINETTHYN